MKWSLCRTLLVLALLSSTGSAFAYQRSMTCGPPPNAFPCDEGEAPIAIAWPSRCLLLHVNEVASQELSLEVAQAALERSTQAWNEVSCSDFQMSFGGLTNEDRVGYTSGAKGNANVIMFRDEGWSHSRGILALTSVTYAPSSGAIVDADIEFNSQSYELTAVDPPGVAIDFENTLTHELGHFLGLDHSTVIGSTMFATAPEGEIDKRTLAGDDIEGFCEIYPAESSPQMCAAATAYFDRAQADALAPVDDGCQVQRMNARTPAPWAAFVGLLGFVLWGRRRRRG